MNWIVNHPYKMAFISGITVWLLSAFVFGIQEIFVFENWVLVCPIALSSTFSFALVNSLSEKIKRWKE